MNRPLLHVLALATATGTAIAGSALPAHAARLVLTDPAGDTWSAAEPAEPAGSARNTDLRRTTIVHGARRVTVRARYVDLVRPRQGETFSLAVRIRGNEGPKRNAFVLVRPSIPRGRHLLFKEASGETVPCPGARHAVSYADDTISLSIPRSCLGRPRWVQLMVAAIDLPAKGHDTIDDAASTGSEPKRWTRRLRRGS